MSPHVNRLTGLLAALVGAVVLVRAATGHLTPHAAQVVEGL